MLEVELPRDRTAPRVAREALKEWFARRLYDDALSTATLLVSELVTNAVLHGHGKITLRAFLDEDRLLVVVIDDGAGPEAAVGGRDREDPRSGGRGLHIVDAASSRWGIRKGTAEVWFELKRPGPGAGSIAALAPHPSTERA